jgi:co-chaperonin GroES (HSP10)
MLNKSPAAPGFTQLRNAALATAAFISLATFVPFSFLGTAAAQAAPAAPATSAARQLGTIKAIDGSTLTLATDAGPQVTVNVSGTARILQLPPGSTDLNAAQAAALSDVAVGDRVLVTGAAGDSPAQFNASRLILMKSGAIAQKHESEQADWQRRGTGGIVSAVDPTTGTLTVSAGSRKLQVVTGPGTIYRRYAGDSTRFEDAKLGNLAQIQVGDQLRIRGGRSQTDTGTTVQAEEIVSGSFKNLSGTLLTVDPAAGHLTLKDLTTKRMMTVTITPNSAVHALPPQAAASFAARESGAGSASAGSPAHTSAATPSARPAAIPVDDSSRSTGERTPGAARSAGGDLSQLVARLPPGSITDLHPGEAVMIVASAPTPSSDTVTVVTLLTGVEPILAAAPSGGAAMTLSPWSVGGGGAPDGGSGAPQ